MPKITLPSEKEFLAIRPFGEAYQAASCYTGLRKCANGALQVAQLCDARMSRVDLGQEISATLRMPGDDWKEMGDRDERRTIFSACHLRRYSA